MIPGTTLDWRRALRTNPCSVLAPAGAAVVLPALLDYHPDPGGWTEVPKVRLPGGP